MNDLTLTELNTLIDWYAPYADRMGVRQQDLDLYNALVKVRDEKAELENMDFDDCVGGACKL